MGFLPTLILMLGVIGMMTLLAQRVSIPAPVLLAVAGVVWSLIPSLPSLRIAPEVILSVFLPPLLYADAWDASWIDFRRWLRPILQLAIGLAGTPGGRRRGPPVYKAKTDALLAPRDQGVVNDRLHQELQLDLDRANADLRAG